MKLFFYSHYFAPMVGGVETIVLSLARGLAQIRSSRGLGEFELTLATQTPAGSYDDDLLPFRVFRQPSYRKVLQAIRSADIVHVAGPALSPMVLGLLAGKPVVVEHHGFQAICPNGQLMIEPRNVPCPGHFAAGRHAECLRCRPNGNWLASGKPWLLTFVRRFLCERITANIVPTEWLGGLTRLPKTVSVPHGIETTGPCVAGANASRPPLIVFQGRLVTTKGLPVLLDAAHILRSQHREFKVLVIGDGPERSSLQDVSAKLQLSSYVQFTGRLAAADLDSVFEAASVVVVPSLAGEVFGLVLVENMLRGLPVISSDLGSFVEVLGDAGLTFRIGDASDLALKIARLLDDTALATQLGDRARLRALDRYRGGQMVEAHAQLYRQIYAAARS